MWSARALQLKLSITATHSILIHCLGNAPTRGTHSVIAAIVISQTKVRQEELATLFISSSPWKAVGKFEIVGIF